MSNYTITTDFGAKDSLPSSNSAKVVRGSEFTTEFTNIQTAIATKADTAGDTFTGAVTFDAAVTLNSTATITGDLTVDTDTLFVDVSADKVGIGTSSPDTLLEVVGADPILTIRDSETSSGATSATLRLAESGGGDTLGNYWDIKHNPNAELSVLAGTAERMRIDSTGNVGIGTSSPALTDGGSGLVTHISDDTRAALRLTTTGGGGDLELRTFSSNGATIFNSANGELRLGTNATERMRIDSSGNVGIGTSSPSAMLDVELGATGTIAEFRGGDSDILQIKNENDSIVFDTRNTASGLAFQMQGTERMRIDSSGNVGIGTDSPDRIVHAEGTPTVFGDSRSVLQLADDTAMAAGVGGGLILTGKALTGQANANTVFGAIQAQKENGTSGNTDSYMTFCTRQNGNNPAERMRIDSSGNVLVGKTAVEMAAVGVEVKPAGEVRITSDDVFGLQLNRKTGDGEIINLRKDGASVGSIGSIAGGIEVTAPTYLVLGCDDTGIRIASNEYVLPYNPSTDALKDGTVSLGVASSRFKDLHLSGTGYFGTSVGIGTTSFTSKFHVGGNMTDYVYSEPAGDSIATFAPTTTGTSSAMNVNIGSGMYGGAGVETARLNFLNGHGNNGFATGFSIKSYKTASATATDEYLAFEEILRAGNTGVTHNERMRIDSSGNVLVGKTSDLISSVGGTIGAAGYITATRDGSAPLSANRLTSDGALVNLYKDGLTVGSVGVSGSRPYLSNGVNDGIKIADDYVAPCNQTGADKDASLDLGSSSVRFKDIYRSGSTYSTSDRNKKQDIRDLTDAEARVATVAKGSLKAFRYIDSVEAEGDEANIHFGIIAQDLKAAFEAEGLNANDYQVFKTSTYTDDDGVEQTTYSVCYENLLAFIIAAI